MIIEDVDRCPVFADTTGAAELLEQAGIMRARDRIYDWKRRGLLHPERTVGRTPVYRMSDVWTVEHDIRTRRAGADRLTLTG